MWVHDALTQLDGLVEFREPTLQPCDKLIEKVHGPLLASLRKQQHDSRELVNGFIWGGAASLEAASTAVSICCAGDSSLAHFYQHQA